MSTLRLLLRSSFRHSQYSLRAMSSTIDNSEIAHFSALSSEWWDENGSMRALHTMNALRVPWIAESVAKGGSVLDVGCGCGLLSEPLARVGLKVTAVDASLNCISVARDRLVNNHLPVEYVHQDQTDTLSEATDGRLFDAVVASEVVEHVTDVDEFLTSLSSHVRPGGALFMTTINRTTAARLLAIYAAEYVLRIVPRGTHQYEKFVTPDELTTKLKAFNFTPSPARGMQYNPVCNQWSWCASTNINYALMAVKNV